MWMGPPEPRIREMRMNFGTQNWNLRKASTDILPSSTLILDLQPDYDVLLKRMKPKTRYNINLAKRKGVQVRVVGEESLDTLYGLYIQTAKRNNLTLNDISFFKSLLDANKTGSDAKVYMLLAEANGFPLAGMFMVITGNRSTYLFGASGNESRNFMGTYALQWEAIRISKQAGCVSYDMFGVSQVPDPSHPLYGLYRFKSGFGGQIYHRQGCWDYPFDEGVYAGFRASELTAEGYHI